MDSTRIDHDRLFKELLRTFFFEFVELFLPEIATQIVPGRVEFLDKEIFTDVGSKDRHEVDLVAKVRFRDGRRAFFLIHVEHQSATQRDFARRMFCYFARLHEKYGLPIYPVVLFSHDRPTRPEPDRYRIEFPHRRVLDFQFDVVQLNRLNWRDFLRRPNPVASALMSRMRFALEDRPRVKLECLRMLATLKLDPARTELITVFMYNYLKLTSEQNSRYHSMVKAVEPKNREFVMQWTNDWREEGRVLGMKEIVIRQINRRFRRLPEPIQQKLGSLNEVQIIKLSDALLDFSDPTDLEKWLNRRRKRSQKTAS